MPNSNTTRRLRNARAKNNALLARGGPNVKSAVLEKYKKTVATRKLNEQIKNLKTLRNTYSRKGGRKH